MIQFIGLEHLKQLNSQDLIMIRLYQNNDTANILWQQALEGLAITSSDNAESDKANSFIITTQANILQTNGPALKHPQDPFELQLLNPISPGDTYQWEISVPDTEKYGTFEFTSAVPTVTPTIGTGNPKTYTWKTALLTDPQYRQIKFKPRELSPRHTPEAYCGYNCTPRGGSYEKDVAQKNAQYTFNIKVIVNSAARGKLEYSGKIQIDQIDLLREEHINHKVSANVNRRVPKRNMFVATADLPPGEWGSSSDTHPYAYDYVLNDGIVEIWNAVSNGFVSIRQAQYQGYDIPNNGLRVTSAYRNPERNEIVGVIKIVCICWAEHWISLLPEILRYLVKTGASCSVVYGQ